MDGRSKRRLVLGIRMVRASYIERMCTYIWFWRGPTSHIVMYGEIHAGSNSSQIKSDRFCSPAALRESGAALVRGAWLAGRSRRGKAPLLSSHALDHSFHLLNRLTYQVARRFP